MRKSENTPAAASTKPSKRDAEDAIRSATEYLIATRQADRALKAGNSAPSFRLRDQRGVEVASETLLRHGPLLLTFYTGLWCPACSRDLQAFEFLRPSVEARGASLVSISQQTVAENAKARAHLKLGFPILSDRGGRIAQLFGVRWCIPELLRDIHRKSGIDLPPMNGGESWTLPIPARFILDRAGVIAYSEINPGQSGRSRRETSCPCWITCAACAPLDPRTAKCRGATTGIRVSNVQAFRVPAKCADQRAASPPEATTPAIRHDSTRMVSR